MLIQESTFKTITYLTFILLWGASAFLLIKLFFKIKRYEKNNITIDENERIKSLFLAFTPFILFIIIIFIKPEPANLWIINANNETLTKESFVIYGSIKHKFKNNIPCNIYNKSKHIIINNTEYLLFIENLNYYSNTELGKSFQFFDESMRSARKYLNSINNYQENNYVLVKPQSYTYFDKKITYFGFDDETPPKTIKKSYTRFEPKPFREKIYWLKW